VALFELYPMAISTFRPGRNVGWLLMAKVRSAALPSNSTMRALGILLTETQVSMDTTSIVSGMTLPSDLTEKVTSEVSIESGVGRVIRRLLEAEGREAVDRR
jgi:hypothetical protein